MEDNLKPRTVLMKITPAEELMVEALKPIASTKTRTKVFKFALKKTFELYKDIKK